MSSDQVSADPVPVQESRVAACGDVAMIEKPSSRIGSSGVSLAAAPSVSSAKQRPGPSMASVAVKLASVSTPVGSSTSEKTPSTQHATQNSLDRAPSLLRRFEKAAVEKKRTENVSSKLDIIANELGENRVDASQGIPNGRVVSRMQQPSLNSGIGSNLVRPQSESQPMNKATFHAAASLSQDQTHSSSDSSFDSGGSDDDDSDGSDESSDFADSSTSGDSDVSSNLDDDSYVYSNNGSSFDSDSDSEYDVTSETASKEPDSKTAGNSENDYSQKSKIQNLAMYADSDNDSEGLEEYRPSDDELAEDDSHDEDSDDESDNTPVIEGRVKDAGEAGSEERGVNIRHREGIVSKTGAGTSLDNETIRDDRRENVDPFAKNSGRSRALLSDSRASEPEQQSNLRSSPGSSVNNEPTPEVPQSPVRGNSLKIPNLLPPASPGRIHEIVPDGNGLAIAKRTRSALSLEDHNIDDLEKFLDEVMQADDGAENDVDEYEKFLASLSGNGSSKAHSGMLAPVDPGASASASGKALRSSALEGNFEGLQYMDSDEDDIDFDPHLDPSALHAFEDHSPGKSKYSVNKDEWEDIVKDAHDFFQKDSRATDKNSSNIFTPSDIERLHLLLQQAMQIDVEICTTKFEDTAKRVSRSKYAPKRMEDKHAFAEMSFAALRHLQTLYMSFLSPRSTVENSNIDTTISTEEILNAGRSVHGVRFARTTRSTSLRQQSVFNLPGMHMLPKLFKTVAKLPDSVIEAHLEQDKQKKLDTATISDTPASKELNCLASCMNFSAVSNFKARYQPYMIFSGISHKHLSTQKDDKNRSKRASRCSRSEDKLIAMGMQRFAAQRAAGKIEYSTAISTSISGRVSKLLPPHTKQQIYNRIKNLRKNKPDMLGPRTVISNPIVELQVRLDAQPKPNAAAVGGKGVENSKQDKLARAQGSLGNSKQSSSANVRKGSASYSSAYGYAHKSELSRLWPTEESLWLLRFEKDSLNSGAKQTDFVNTFIQNFPHRNRKNVRRHLASKKLKNIRSRLSVDYSGKLPPLKLPCEDINEATGIFKDICEKVVPTVLNKTSDPMSAELKSLRPTLKEQKDQQGMRLAAINAASAQASAAQRAQLSSGSPSSSAHMSDTNSNRKNGDPFQTSNATSIMSSGDPRNVASFFLQQDAGVMQPFLAPQNTPAPSDGPTGLSSSSFPSRIPGNGIESNMSGDIFGAEASNIMWSSLSVSEESRAAISENNPSMPVGLEGENSLDGTTWQQDSSRIESFLDISKPSPQKMFFPSPARERLHSNSSKFAFGDSFSGIMSNSPINRNHNLQLRRRHTGSVSGNSFSQSRIFERSTNRRGISAEESMRESQASSQDNGFEQSGSFQSNAVSAGHSGIISDDNDYQSVSSSERQSKQKIGMIESKSISSNIDKMETTKAKSNKAPFGSAFEIEMGGAESFASDHEFEKMVVDNEDSSDDDDDDDDDDDSNDDAGSTAQAFNNQRDLSSFARQGRRVFASHAEQYDHLAPRQRKTLGSSDNLQYRESNRSGELSRDLRGSSRGLAANQNCRAVSTTSRHAGTKRKISSVDAQNVSSAPSDRNKNESLIRGKERRKRRKKRKKSRESDLWSKEDDLEILKAIKVMGDSKNTWQKLAMTLQSRSIADLRKRWAYLYDQISK